jgi:hypothetical protein
MGTITTATLTTERLEVPTGQLGVSVKKGYAGDPRKTLAIFIFFKF